MGVYIVVLHGRRLGWWKREQHGRPGDADGFGDDDHYRGDDRYSCDIRCIHYVVAM